MSLFANAAGIMPEIVIGMKSFVFLFWCFMGPVEWSAVELAERSLRSEDGRTADTAGMDGRYRW